MHQMPALDLKPRLTGGAIVDVTQNGWQLTIPEGRSGSYRLAQMDDQLGRKRSAYSWKPPVRLSLRARASHEAAPGTWGFGFWNDPYGFSFGPGESFPRLPALPQTAWFFSASPRSYLSFRDDKPANGFYAQAFRSAGFTLKLIQPLVMLPLSPRTSRRLLRATIAEDGAAVSQSPCDWHDYGIDWTVSQCTFYVDGTAVLATPISPPGPLGLVIWIDNQYAAFDPQGRIAWGTEHNPTPQWIEVEQVRLEAGS